jgi:hypothetical protein
MGRAIRIAGVAVLAVLTRVALGQPKPDHRVPVVTVCEVLSDPFKYSDTPVLLVARTESSVSSIDRYDWFSQDGCEHPVVTRRGRVWPTHIDCCQLGTPPDDNVEIDEALVRAKLDLVKKTTQLGSHKEPHIVLENGKFKNMGEFDESNQWAVVYGRIVAAANLGGREDCDLANTSSVEAYHDCFGFRGAPVGIVLGKRENVRRLEPLRCCQP